MTHAHDHAHGHGHNHGHAGTEFGPAFALGSALNFAFVVAEVAFGLAANSVALLADAAHNLGDVLALLLAWGATVLARRAPSARRTYGWGRGTIIAALINAVVLLVSVGAIALEAIGRFADPAPVAGVTVMAVATIGIAVNGFTAWLFSRGHGDLNIRAAFQHMAADAVVSAGVVLGALLILLTGWHWIDPVMGLAVAFVILAAAWTTLRDGMHLAMDGVPGGIERHAVEERLQALPGVLEVHDLHIWGLSTTDTALTAHLVCADLSASAALTQAACHALAHDFEIGHVTIQIETPATADACKLRPAEVI